MEADPVAHQPPNVGSLCVLIGGTRAHRETRRSDAARLVNYLLRLSTIPFSNGHAFYRPLLQTKKARRCQL
jgi:hypothetical protein